MYNTLSYTFRYLYGLWCTEILEFLQNRYYENCTRLTTAKYVFAFIWSCQLNFNHLSCRKICLFTFCICIHIAILIAAFWNVRDGCSRQLITGTAEYLWSLPNNDKPHLDICTVRWSSLLPRPFTFSMHFIKTILFQIILIVIFC